MKDKRVVITGAGRDFGQALSCWFAQEGAIVDLCARTIESAIETEILIRVNNGIARPYKCDITDSFSINNFVNELISDTKSIDVLVLNAAQWLEGDLNDATDEEIINTINSGLTGSILLTKALLPYLNKKQGADIIIMVSVCGIPFYFNSIANPAFFAAKSGLSGFGLNIAHNLSKDKIRVTNFYPPDFEVTGIYDEIIYTKITNNELLNARSIWEAIKLCINLPRNSHINSITFQGPTRQEISNY